MEVARVRSPLFRSTLAANARCRRRPSATMKPRPGPAPAPAPVAPATTGTSGPAVPVATAATAGPPWFANNSPAGRAAPVADVGLSFGEFSAEDMSAYFSQSAKVDAVVLRPFDTVVVARISKSPASPPKATASVLEAASDMALDGPFTFGDYAPLVEAPAATNGTTPKSLSVRPPPTPAASPRPLLAQTPQPPPPPAPETDDLDVAEQGLPIVYAPSDLTPVNTQPFTVRPTVPTPPPASTSSGSAGRPVRHVQQADSPWKSSLSFSQVAAKAAVSARPPPMSPASANGSSGRPPASSQQGDTSPLRRASVQATPISSPPATDTDVSSNTSASAIDGDKQPTDPFDPKLYGIPDPFPDIHEHGFAEAVAAMEKREHDMQEHKHKEELKLLQSQKPANVWADRSKLAAIRHSSSSSSSTSSSSQSEPGTPKAQLSIFDQIDKYQVSFKPVYIQPRGLVNQGNMCYLNGILHPLLLSAPFRNFITSFDPLRLSAVQSTPFLQTIVSFFDEFAVMSESELKAWKVGDHTKFGNPINPISVYSALRQLRSTSSYYAGRQEDAEEFLGIVLSAMHDECLKVKRDHVHRQSLRSTADADSLAAATELEISSGQASFGDSPTRRTNGDHGNGDDSWLEIGSKGKTRFTREAEEERSPIIDIFGGKQRTELRFKLQGRKPQVTIEPFKSLPLDIAAQGVESIADALNSIAVVEMVDYLDDSSKTKIDTTRQTLFEKLPPVLILHLKRFVYDKASNDILKERKFVQYPMRLEINPGPASKGFDPPVYALSGVVYHHGVALQGGHYTCDVLHPADEWFRIDDEKIMEVKKAEVLAYKQDRDAYVLFYTAIPTSSQPLTPVRGQ